ncbi:hypothetical protein, partial [Streptococcus agalactiae]|uniref:hypothetical protein n=1 Tax=Streptococcus agalactiae TaxID=1311 RepID=UPI0012FE16ED
NKSLSSEVSQLYYTGFIPFCVYTRYFTLPSDDKYILISAKNGIFYSYKENNHLKIRCMFKRNSPYATNVSITEYRKCEEK